MNPENSKTINLLYTHVDSHGNFLANGNELGIDNTIFSDGYNFLSTHVCSNEFNRNQTIKINREHINNFDKNKTYFYIISHPSLSLNECLEQKFIVSDLIINLSQKYNNIFITFLYEHEPDNEDLFDKIIEYLEKYKLDSSKFIIINNNSNLYNIKNHYNTKIKVHKSGFLAYSSFRVFNNLNVSFNTEKIGKFFICRNRTPKQHRLSLILYFYLESLLDDINYSFVPELSNRVNNSYGYIQHFDVSILKQNQELINYINNHTKYDEYEKALNWFDIETNDFTHNRNLPPIFLVPELVKSFENSYFNIVTESTYNYPLNVTHVTEKSFRPFFYYQFPLFLSTHNHVSYLRSEYGFDLFDDIINHSYDGEINPKIRIKMLVDEIIRINNNKDFFIDFYKNNKDRFLKNKEKYQEIAYISKEKDFEFFWNLL